MFFLLCYGAAFVTLLVSYSCLIICACSSFVICHSTSTSQCSFHLHVARNNDTQCTVSDKELKFLFFPVVNHLRLLSINNFTVVRMDNIKTIVAFFKFQIHMLCCMYGHLQQSIFFHAIRSRRLR